MRQKGFAVMKLLSFIITLGVTAGASSHSCLDYEAAQIKCAKECLDKNLKCIEKCKGNTKCLDKCLDPCLAKCQLTYCDLAQCPDMKFCQNSTNLRLKALDVIPAKAP